MELNNEQIKLLDAYAEAKMERAAWEAQEKLCRLELLSQLGDATLGSIEGRTVIQVLERNSSRFDVTEFKKDWPKYYQEYTKPIKTKVVEIY